MENIKNEETIPADSEIPKLDERLQNPQEKGADVPMPVVENQSAEQIKALRQDILSVDNKGLREKSESAKPESPPSPVEIPASGGGWGMAGSKIGKFLRGGFIFLGGLLVLGISQGFSGMMSMVNKISKGKGGGSHGGASHAKSSSKPAPSSGHAASSGHKKEGGHGHH